MASALASARACEGRSAPPCGPEEPSSKSVGSPTPFITIDTSEWIGAISVTTRGASAIAGEYKNVRAIVRRLSIRIIHVRLARIVSSL
jgi:hypothetical protein